LRDVFGGKEMCDEIVEWMGWDGYTTNLVGLDIRMYDWTGKKV
jgi:hypothetical protein